MLRTVLYGAVLYIAYAVYDEMFSANRDPEVTHRMRVLKFAVYQDMLLLITVLRMVLLEGYTLSGVLQRVRTAGLMTQVYIATSVALHGTLLLEEPVNQRLRLNPVPYVPPDLPEARKDLFLL